jgi:outer membrane receptor protein involved in Fe transport
MECTTARRRRTLSQAIAVALGVARLGTALSQTASFDLPEQDAATAIPEFARQANLQIIAPADKLVGIKTHMVHGAMDARAALKQLLEGTGLTIASDDGRTISLRFPESTERHTDTPVPAPATGQLEEVVVTATRRAENLQDVPIAITALTGITLRQLNVQTFDDFLKYLPNVTVADNGPGQSEIYMRGLSATQTNNFISAGTGTFPNVAVYLDDQSAQMPGRNLDIYAADLERIEVLEGPQGTLFGAGAQAGVLRYITNKPKINTTEAGVDASYSTTAQGDPNASVQAYINLPVIEDTLAMRAVIYDDSRGGYIHNIPGTFTRSGTDLGIVDYFGGARNGHTVITPGVVPPGSPSISNSALVNSAYNPTVYTGIRASGLYKFNDDWNFLLEQSYQNLEADGVYGYTPSLGDLNVQQWNPSSDHDRFEDTAWTLNGRIDALKLVYTGGYLVRNVNQVTDYTNYARGIYADYYQCNGPAFGAKSTSPTNICYSPSQTEQDIARNTHQSHELRVSTPDDWRARGIVGLFYEDYKIQDNAMFNYGAPEAGFSPQAPLAGTTVFDPSVRPVGVGYFNDITRGYKQKAVFGDFSFEIIPKQLTLSLGTRFYSMDTYLLGSKNSVYGCRGAAPGTCSDPSSGSLDALGLRETFTGHKSKATLSWKITDQALVYATYSEGFRPGGFNIGTGVLTPNSPLYGIFTVPKAYSPDTLKNYEAGWKTTWLDHRLQFNGAIYEEDWYDVQVSITDPTLYGNLNFSVNGPHYRVRGAEGDLAFLITDGLTVNSSFAWNSSSQQNAPSLLSNSGAVVSLVPTAGIGSSLAQAPPFQGNLRVRYEVPVGGYVGYGQIGGQHTDHSYSSILTAGAYLPQRQLQDPYSTYDAALGVKKDAWIVEAYGENLTDTRAQLYVNVFQFVRYVDVNRPRTLGVRMSYKF